MADSITCKEFGQFLVDEQPHYDPMVLETIRPTDGWIGHVSTGPFPAFSGTSLYQDRFEVVWPDTTQEWEDVEYTNCLGTPCDPTESEIGAGSTRRNYGLERQSWKTQLLCWDSMIHVSHAKENVRQWIGRILKPAQTTIQSAFLRKRALFWADHKWVADANMTEFTYIWQTSGTREIYLLTSAMPTSKLMPGMLQWRVNRLLNEGYMGHTPFLGEKNPPLIELVTDLETLDSLTKLGGTTGIGAPQPSVAQNWRFEQWDAASKFWRYGFSGQIGNYAARLDPHAMRFNYIGPSGNATYPYRFQVIQPFINIASSGAGGAPGLKSIYNPAYQRAIYRMSFIWHKKAMEVLTMESPAINSEMPFKTRSFGGNWQFVMDNLTCGTDVNGNPIAVDNSRRNKGRFIADFKLAIRPLYTEFAEAIFHKGEPACLFIQDVCSTNAYPGYPVQSYSSANEACP